MTLEEVYQYYGNATKAAEAVFVARQTFHSWLKKGFIPIKQQLIYEKITKGKLKAEKDPNCIKKTSKSAIFPQFRYYSDTLGMCVVHSLTYLSDREPRILYYSPINKQVKFSSFRYKNLMQHLCMKDTSNNPLYEGDIVLAAGVEEMINSIHDFASLTRLYVVRDFLIIGNKFEGKK